MRTIAILAWACMCMPTHAQEQLCEGAITYAEWVDADTMAQAGLYERAMQWMLCNGTAIDSLTYWSRSDGMVRGVGSLPIHAPHTMEPIYVLYTFTISARDGRYHHAIGEFNVRRPGHTLDAQRDVSVGPSAGAACIAIERHARAMFAALDAYMVMRRP